MIDPALRSVPLRSITLWLLATTREHELMNLKIKDSFHRSQAHQNLIINLPAPRLQIPRPYPPYPGAMPAIYLLV